MNGKIDFLGIGAQKGGTTWLFKRMKELSGFTLPYIKELHYFDRSKNYPTSVELSEELLIERLINIHFIKRSVYGIFINTVRTKDIKKIKWFIKWYYSNYNDNWYLSLFNSFKGITGEISPSYALLKNEDIEKMYQLLPNTKIIFLIRNPIDRAWSHYRFQVRLWGNDRIDEEMLREEKIKEYFNDYNRHLRSNYILTIDRYLKYYNSGQLLIGFYDAIQDQPEKLLEEIVRFLKGDVSKIKEECNFYKKDNVSPSMKMPDEIRTYLVKEYKPIMEELALRYGGYCQKWLDDLNIVNKKSKKTNFKNYPSSFILNKSK